MLLYHVLRYRLSMPLYIDTLPKMMEVTNDDCCRGYSQWWEVEGYQNNNKFSEVGTLQNSKIIAYIIWSSDLNSLCYRL